MTDRHDHVYAEGRCLVCSEGCGDLWHDTRTVKRAEYCPVCGEHQGGTTLIVMAPPTEDDDTFGRNPGPRGYEAMRPSVSPPTESDDDAE